MVKQQLVLFEFHVGRIQQKSFFSSRIHKKCPDFIVRYQNISNFGKYCFNLKYLSLSVYMILETTAAVIWSCSLKKVLFRFLQNSQ